ncbi:class F sortase [Thermomonospora umbrina]|uniref:Sortase family protein n=1 Tax=Thermomonospora umbrina TaxID=111806 RepID=A0A3D9SH83_9ACTN|nr:class F sortase [Thermomonospora umbrina]REE95278.1 sortase family protein [Thermomonospora umbrina]
MRPTAGALIALAVGSAGALLTGCGGDAPERAAPPVSRPVPTWTGVTSSPPAPPSGRPSARASVTSSATPERYAPPLPRSLPVSIRIPRIGVSAPVSRLGLLPDGRIEVPPLGRPELTGWYEKGPTPGEAGPSVILGHVDAHRRPAVFHRLTELRTGDRVEVTRRDGSVAVFAVQQMARVSKSRFPGEMIYGEDLDHSALRLVTCGGSVDSRTGHYVDNVIAFTRLVR